MGRTYQFECAKCGYRARVSGGADSGTLVVVRTIICHDCRKLYDAVVEAKLPALMPKPLLQRKSLRKPAGRAPRLGALVNRLQSDPKLNLRWKQFPLACPVSRNHRIEEWQPPGKCPRCGSFLNQGGIPYRLWD